MVAGEVSRQQLQKSCRRQKEGRGALDGLRIAVNVIVDPSDENIIPLVGQMDFVIPVHVLVAQGRRQIVKNDSFRKTILNLKKKIRE